MEAVDDWSAQIVKPATRPFREVSKGYTSFAENDVLVAKITPCMENGKCAIARGLRDRIGFGSTEFHVLRASTRVLPEWLLYFWRLPETRRNAERCMTGTAGQKRVPSSHLKQVKIRLPDLTTQTRVIKQLEQADRLRRTGRYALELSDTFLPAAFVSLFGNPANNRKYPLVSLGELIVSGPQNGLYKPAAAYGSGTRIVRIDAYQNSSAIDFAELKRVRLSSDEIATYGLRKGDFLINRVNSRTHLGKSTVVPQLSEPAVYESNMMRFRVDEKRLNSVYAAQLLHTPFINEQIQKQAKDASNQSSINQEDVEGFAVLLPPLAAQRHFAALVLKHERLRANQREALRQADHLFQSLLHLCFSENG
jgi:type I restriction enzyme S subunit